MNAFFFFFLNKRRLVKKTKTVLGRRRVLISIQNSLFGRYEYNEDKNKCNKLSELIFFPLISTILLEEYTCRNILRTYNTKTIFFCPTHVIYISFDRFRCVTWKWCCASLVWARGNIYFRVFHTLYEFLLIFRLIAVALYRISKHYIII